MPPEELNHPAVFFVYMVLTRPVKPIVGFMGNRWIAVFFIEHIGVKCYYAIERDSLFGCQRVELVV